MVELNSLDDVGQGYDIALGEPERIATTLGAIRKRCNVVLSEVAVRLHVEYGWGGRKCHPGSGRRRR